MPICRDCGEEKGEEKFALYKVKEKTGRRSLCKDCKNIKNSSWRENNKKLCSELTMNWQKRNKDKVEKANKKYHLNNHDEIIKRRRLERKELVDSYIKRVLCDRFPGVKANEFPKEMVEAQRERVKSYRLLKQYREELNAK